MTLSTFFSPIISPITKFMQGGKKSRTSRKSRKSRKSRTSRKSRKMKGG